MVVASVEVTLERFGKNCKVPRVVVAFILSSARWLVKYRFEPSARFEVDF